MIPSDLSEANKLRTFFRVMFAASALTLGADGLTARKHVNSTRQVNLYLFTFEADLQVARRVPRANLFYLLFPSNRCFSHCTSIIDRDSYS